MQAGSNLPLLTASLPVHPVSLDPAVVSAAQHGVTELLATLDDSWVSAARSAGTLMGSDASTGMQALALLASERLAALQTIDVQSYESMRSTLSDVSAALGSYLSSHAGAQASAYTTSLVLSLQQILGDPAAGGLHSAAGMSTMASISPGAGALVLEAGPSLSALEGLVGVSLGLVAMLVASVPRARGAEAEGAVEDAVPAVYSPDSLSAYWSSRPLMVARRSAEVGGKLGGFLVRVLGDAQLGQAEARMPQRAAELRRIIEALGATPVKIAQALSTRVDMLPQAYLDEFQSLQDNVATFSTSDARVVLEEGLGRSVDTIFEWLSEEPVAAASLGQVYRGQLLPEHGASEVAVKVQRPGVLEAAALDVFIMRLGAVLFSKLPGMSDSWADVLDDWALRFFQEMDYQNEAANTMTFKRNMASLSGVVIPTVHPMFTSRKIIVTDWIVGEKLSEATPGDIRTMCNTLLNCYLIQLLETGLLHVDPHPGNLMRTHDGRLVILDFGLVTEVTDSQKIALIEFIAHLTMEDWDALTSDLVTLGFMPGDMPEEARKHIKPIMTQVFSKIINGGGLGKAGLNFTSLGMQLSHISMSYQLCIPGYFTNVLRAFSVIEGIALRVDPDYSIVQECWPYLSRRLLSDNNPRMRVALRQLLYGNGQRLDVARVKQLASAFSAFTTGGVPSGGGGVAGGGPTFQDAFGEESVKGGTGGALVRVSAAAAAPNGPVVNPMMIEALKVVFSKDGTYAQELIVEELVAATDAMSREALSESLRMVVGSASAMSALRGMEALGPLRAMLLPIPLPMELLTSMEPTVRLTQEDRAALATVRAVLDLLQSSAVGLPNAAAAGTRAVRAASEVMPHLPELMPGIQNTTTMFVRQLVRRMALRLADDLGPVASAAPMAAARMRSSR